MPTTPRASRSPRSHATHVCVHSSHVPARPPVVGPRCSGCLCLCLCCCCCCRAAAQETSVVLMETGVSADSVLCTGHLLAMSSRRARCCSLSRGPCRLICRSIRSTCSEREGGRV